MFYGDTMMESKENDYVSQSELPDSEFKAHHLEILLSKCETFEKVLAIEIEHRSLVFYSLGRVLICPPVSDHDASPNALPTIQKVLVAAQKEGLSLDTFDRLVFPLFEEQPYIIPFLISKPREHWVTVTYDIKSKDAILYDSTGYFRGSTYTSLLLDAQLSFGLHVYNKEVCLPVDRVYLDIEKWDPQQDKNVSGHWTIYMIRQWSKKALSAVSVLKHKTIDDVIKKNKELYEADIPNLTAVVSVEGELNHFVSPLQKSQNHGDLPYSDASTLSQLKNRHRLSQLNIAKVGDPTVFPNIENVMNLNNDFEQESNASDESAANMLQWYWVLFLGSTAIMAVGLLCLSGHIAFVPPLVSTVATNIGFLGMFGGALGLYMNRSDSFSEDSNERDDSYGRAAVRKYHGVS